MICPGCKNECDEEICWCGDTKEFHGLGTGHSFVPIGCDCGRIKTVPALDPGPDFDPRGLGEL